MRASSRRAATSEDGGAYSGFQEEGTFLRGAQPTGDEGIARFTTIYPGWYPGRAVHIHLKVHVDNQTLLTSQLYFDESVSDRVFAAAPYEPGRDQTNASDGIFDERLVLSLREQDDGILGTISFDVRA